MSSADLAPPLSRGAYSTGVVHHLSAPCADREGAFSLKMPQFQIKIVKFWRFSSFSRHFIPGVGCMPYCDTGN